MSESKAKVDLSYNLIVENKEDGFSVAELKKKGMGGADGILFGACAREANGSFSPYFFTGKAAKEPFNARELYDVWVSLGKKVLETGMSAEEDSSGEGTLTKEEIQSVVIPIMIQEERDAQNKRRDTGSDHPASETSSGSEQTGNDDGLRESVDKPGSGHGDGEMVREEEGIRGIVSPFNQKY